MPVLSYIHQLFNIDQCQAYIHTLRWKDRPLQCPRCQSHNVGPWGTYHYQPGLKRYRCKDKDCKRTFNDLTNTLLHQSKRSLSHWILAMFLLCLACSSRRIARELGVRHRTRYRWCWWLRNAALSYEMQRQLEGTVEADVRREERTRAHALVVMLAYQIIRYLASCWSAFDVTVAEGLHALTTLCLVEVAPQHAPSYHCLPTPRDAIARLLHSADITLPKAFSLSGVRVSTKKKLQSERMLQ